MPEDQLEALVELVNGMPAILSLLMDDEAVERAEEGVRAYFVESTGFATVDDEGRVMASYGGHWIYLSPAALARAALTAAYSPKEG